MRLTKPHQFKKENRKPPFFPTDEKHFILNMVLTFWSSVLHLRNSLTIQDLVNIHVTNCRG